ncbi:TetR/AcrR family transcriptional regulator [Lentzea flaviverrucosa]|uniref:Transcriptional regulator, TetR family n=1 Tax=Lentzea flaviverrucosa TaxID=200379 RepID=A0A1H9F0C5_9PSEU|nr:helix-turn-helix domain-containing protein [Lentzea flaviverrucosa]RDI35343.1 TetR family transcriptional regulator [Lentzea flaviverrucosa]SEQ31406.1 transcriptional regulator, TetR family [Lentzea flaviverrucosa]
MGRPPLADREAIIRTALEIGLSRLTMPAVGERLGISHFTLYRYFRSRNDRAAAAVDQAVDAIEWPEPGEDWRAYLAETAWAHWRLYSAHIGLAREITALRVIGPALVKRANQTGVLLLDYGFDPVDAVLVVDMAELVTQAFLAAPEQADGADHDAVDVLQRRRQELIGPAWVSELPSPRSRWMACRLAIRETTPSQTAMLRRLSRAPDCSRLQRPSPLS